LNIYISQGNVTMQLKCGGIFSNHFITLFHVPVEEFLKLVNIWWRYGQKFGGTFFMVHCVVVMPQ